MGKLTIKKVLIIAISFLCFTACDDDVNSIFDDSTVVIDNSIYQSTITNNYTISNVNLSGNLLTIKVSSSGCSGDSWKAILVDANEIAESDPVQRFIKLSLENKEACLAVFEKEFTFDITKLTKDFYRLTLNLEGWNNQINYN